MPLIPRDPTNLPTEYETIPEDEQCHVIIREAKLADKVDKSSNHYGVITYEVQTPAQFEGRTITDYYVGFEDAVDPHMSDGQRRRALERGVRFNQICACFGVKPEMTPCNPLDEQDLETVNTMLEQDFVGAEGDIIVSVSVFQGRKNNKVKMYLLP